MISRSSLRVGKPVFMDGINGTRAFQRRLAPSALPKMRWHDLRHTYATLMLSAGVPLG
jgi:integrase